ncbi:MAG TPA: DedA family protein [Candidatus Eisenbacteria bacterium]|nr:DedA family protein [Candidatus Eisenbacteria bacterium]
MDVVTRLVDFILHIDHHLDQIIQTYGTGTYFLLFAIVFCETGLVVTPFLPGDSLLFAVGAFAARGSLELIQALLVLMSASILGDSTNYLIGSRVGPAVFHKRGSRWLNPAHLERTHRFYEKHGAKTVILARFLPIVRTFAPFVAGIGRMSYPRFLAYSVAGSVLWVGLFVLAGYFFGNIPVVRDNFSLVVMAIIALSVMPVVVELIRHRMRPAEPGPRRGTDPAP